MAGYNVTATLSVKDKNFSSQMRAAIGQLEDMDKATGNSSTPVPKWVQRLAQHRRLLKLQCRP